VIERIRRYWQSDPYSFAGSLAITLGFLCWAAPLSPGIGYGAAASLGDGSCEGHALSLLVVEVRAYCENTYDGVKYSLSTLTSRDWFSLERLQAIAFFFALGAFLFFLGHRQGRR
jgi:hypothetical protein